MIMLYMAADGDITKIPAILAMNANTVLTVLGFEKANKKLYDYVKRR